MVNASPVVGAGTEVGDLSLIRSRTHLQERRARAEFKDRDVATSGCGHNGVEERTDGAALGPPG